MSEKIPEEVYDVVAFAMAKFSPDKLIRRENLMSSNGKVFLNKEKVVHDIVDEVALSAVMELDYGWNRRDYEHSLIYFENGDDGNIYGGIYNSLFKKEITRKVILAAEGWPESHYTYGENFIQRASDALT